MRSETIFELESEKTMNTLKSLVLAVALTFALTVSTAGETSVCNPGETQTPPCPSAPALSDDTATVLGERQTPPETQSVEIVSLVELALYVMLLA